MKCFILAGGSSDRLWPLSRKNHPKQFMEMREHRSIFQETVLRNIPFCEEYVIITNHRYEKIVKGQLRPFQQIKYKLLLEEDDAVTGTALPIVLALLRYDLNEEVMIVASDAVIEGNYNQTIINLNAKIRENYIGVVGSKPTNNWRGYNYLYCSGVNITAFAKENKDGNCLWDCGICGGRVKNFLSAIDIDFITDCSKRLPYFQNIINKKIADGFCRRSISSLFNVDMLRLVRATFDYCRIIDLRTYNDYAGRKKKELFSLQSASNDVDIINMEDYKSVIVNDVSDLLVVNTRDALYISSHGNVADIKRIMKQNHEIKPSVFDESSYRYENWGYTETLYSMPGYNVIKEIVYPDEEIPLQSSSQYATIITIAKGTAIVTLGKKKKGYNLHQSVFIPVGSEFGIKNIDESELILMVTQLGDSLCESPVTFNEEAIVKLVPYLKECIWGGNDLAVTLGKDLGGKNNIGESWELSTHPVGESIIFDGKYAGKTLRQYIEIIGKDNLGWKAQAFDEFPLMIKFIDAHDKLSIQVHPSDEYAFPNEKEYGKNELWYIISAKPNSYIYAGFKQKVSPLEIKDRIKKDTIEEILNKIPVSAGQTYFLRAGTVHAIGEGCLVCEIQQSSNVTYRLYDYNRTDKAGHTRKLHLKKALDVLNLLSSVNEFKTEQVTEPYQNGTKEMLGECKYFSAIKYNAKNNLTVKVDHTSFIVFVILEGDGIINDSTQRTHKPFTKGDTFFGIDQFYRFMSNGNISLIAVTL